MRIPLAIAALVALALFVPAASAQAPSFDETFQVRVAYGNIPTTDRTEPANVWNVEQRLLAPASTSNQTFVFDLPAGATFDPASDLVCDVCTSTVTSGRVNVILPAGDAQTVSVFTRNGADRDAFAFQVTPPTADPSQVLIVYAPIGTDVALPAGAQKVGTSTDGTAVIHFASGAASDPLPTPLWASVHPQGADKEAGPRPAPSFDWLLVGVAFFLGMLLWAFLVSRGAVQRRSRKQVVSSAAHVEAAREGKTVLEARKLALMAGLKELEMAKMNKQVEDAAYDKVKAEFKAEAVTTMRALDEGETKQ